MVDVLDWEVVDVVVAVTAPGVEETAGVADCDFDADIEREEEELMEVDFEVVEVVETDLVMLVDML
jgi:hypothetical protein